jgi:hypothetical protein
MKLESLILKAAAAQKSAALAPESDFNVILNDDGDGAVIIGYTGPGGNIIIPATIQGMPVVSVVMKPPMQKVGTGRYSTNDTINSIQDVDNFGKKQEIMKDANASLISVVIPEGVRWVGGFQDCAALRSVTLPDSVTTIADRAFGNCTSLTSVTIPEGVTEIGVAMFHRCTSLASVTIPDSVTMIDNAAFKDCTSLATVTISPIKRKWYGGGLEAFWNCPKVNLASQAALRAAGYRGGFD